MGKTITISGKVVYKDKSPISGAKVKIWETDSMQKNNKDDLIVNDTSNSKGKFSGSGKWKDGGLFEVATYRYEVTYKGKTKTGKNITNPHKFFDELNTKWLSPAQEKEEEEKDSITINGKVTYKDGTAISGAKIKIWETDSMQANNLDDLIVNDTSDSKGKFSGTGRWKDSGLIDKATYRYEVNYNGKTKTGANITNPHNFFEELNTKWLSPAQEKEEREKENITISGKVVYKDKTPIEGAKIKIWETDSMQKNNPDDLIVNDTTGKHGRFSGSGRWKDSGLVDVATYRYEVTFKGETKKGTNITNPHNFFEELNTKWLSPAQLKEEREKENITVSGKVVYKDKTPIAGARVKIWETDNFKKNNDDDLIVNVLSDKNGNFSGTGRGKDTGGIQTFRYKITMPGTNLVAESKIKELPKSSLKTINTKWEKNTWKNWIDRHETVINPNDYHYPKSSDAIKNILNIALNKNLKVKVVGSGHSHSKVAQPVENNLLIDLSKWEGELQNYPWLKNRSQLNLPDKHDLVHVKSGTKLRTLNRTILAPKKLGLINMGPFDGQTIAGVVNTNTHGTGIDLGGFSDMVRSMEMLVVVPDENHNFVVETWIIEPKDGITDPTAFKKMEKNKYLVQNDNVFYSAVCGYGLFGIACSYVLEVRELYWLDENFNGTNWKKIKDKFNKLENGIPKLIANNHQVKVYVNTAQCIKQDGINDDIDCRFDTWNEQPMQLKPIDWDDGGEIHKIWPPMRPRSLKSVGKMLSGLTFDINGPFNNGKASPATLSTLSGSFFNEKNTDHFLRDYSSSAYYRAIKRLRDNNLKYDPKLKKDRIDNTKFVGEPETTDYGISIEFSVPISDTIEAIKVSMKHLSQQSVNFVTPTGVRFTKASKHYLCPAYNQDSSFIEITGWQPDNRRKDWDKFKEHYDPVLGSLFDKLRRKFSSVRFHMGKYNLYKDDILRDDYPMYDTWVKYYHFFNASSVFDCPNADKWELHKSKPNFTLGKIFAHVKRLKV